MLEPKLAEYRFAHLMKRLGIFLLLLPLSSLLLLCPGDPRSTDGEAADSESNRAPNLDEPSEPVSDRETSLQVSATNRTFPLSAPEASIPETARSWAETNAPAAATWVLQLPDGSPRNAAIEQVAIAWANADLTAAKEWVTNLPDGENARAATRGVAYEAARVDPLTALELACPLAPTPERDDLIMHS